MLTVRTPLMQLIILVTNTGRDLMPILKTYNELLKDNDNERDWTIAEMNEAVKNGYLFYYWTIYKHNEEDRRKAS